ncbi:MAG: ABC transporter substrate-binding protein [Chloroflexi bacterium]|nr:ABC transporter substrate-binding protein [Chloroflexota bacterium]MCL5075879.1 ABC transporter substrate-binding protein [Chloroflexota bacterium]
MAKRKRQDHPEESSEKSSWLEKETSRRSFLKLSAFAAAGLGLAAAGCAPAAAPTPTPTKPPVAAATPTPTPKPAPTPTPTVIVREKRNLVVSTWGGMTEESLKKYVIPKFEKESNCTVTLDIGGQGARYNKLLAQKASPTVDVFFSTDEAVHAGLKENLFAKLEAKNIPRWKEVYDWMNTTGEYGVTYSVITYALAYHTEKVKNPPTSWNDCWREEFKKRFSAPAPAHSNAPAFLITAAELAGGSVDNIEPGFKKLAELRPNKLTVFWTDWAPLLKTGDTWLATEFDYYVRIMQVQGYPVEFVLPKEKGFVAVETLSVVNGSKNKELAEAYINAMLDPEGQAAIAKDYFIGPSNKNAKVDPAVANKISYGDNLTKLGRVFDSKIWAERRPMWTEKWNTEVLPKWQV